MPLLKYCELMQVSAGGMSWNQWKIRVFSAILFSIADQPQAEFHMAHAGAAQRSASPLPLPDKVWVKLIVNGVERRLRRRHGSRCWTRCATISTSPAPRRDAITGSAADARCWSMTAGSIRA